MLNIDRLCLLGLLAAIGGLAALRNQGGTAVRLVGGNHPHEGRVEIYLRNNRTWQTICADDAWDDKDAAVVCRQLGYSNPAQATAYRSAHFGRGVGPIYASDFQCTGAESALPNCPKASITGSKCTHAQDAGVSCIKPVLQSVRLVGGDYDYAGRVELNVNGTWGTVCSRHWNDKDAAVVCRLLGYSEPAQAQAYGGGHFGQGVGPIYLGGLHCSGQEASLLDCSTDYPFGQTEPWCTHSNDAGVSCIKPVVELLRLVGGNHPYVGRVELRVNGTWGTICDKNWEDRDAAVICRQLGYQDVSRAKAYKSAHFGQGVGPIYLSTVDCRGQEEDILSCPKGYPFGQLDDSCSHRSDAGVACSREEIEAVRLSGGSEPYEGRVEVKVNGTWGTVCHSDWGESDAVVVCRQLGFSNPNQQATAYTSAYFGQGEGPVHVHRVHCRGQERELKDCPSDSVHSCTHATDAGVSCVKPVVEQVRLSDGSRLGSGRVELLVNGTWGTVCDDQWDDNDAAVICRQLQFPNPSQAIAYKSAHFGQGQGPVYLTQLFCTGQESDIIGCKRRLPFGQNWCPHNRDAGVSCSRPVLEAVHLVGGDHIYEGRVELLVDGTWGTVCDNRWDDKDAAVVCRQLGYTDLSEIKSYKSAHFGQGSGPIYLQDVHCTGHESSILDCPALPFGQHSCNHRRDASLSCVNNNGCDNSNGNCSDACEALPGNKTRCLCLAGGHLSPDQKTCVADVSTTISPTPDIAGCQDNNGGCSDRCNSLPGNKTQCTCPKGKSLSPDQKNCVVDVPKSAARFQGPSVILVAGVAGGIIVFLLVVIIVLVVLFIRRIGQFKVTTANNDRARTSGLPNLVFQNETFNMNEHENNANDSNET